MKKDTVIEVNNVSKKFCKNLPHIIKYGLIDIGKSVIGLKTASDKLRKHEFWAVNDVSFKLKKSETLGIIGPNGSGKSTLLKLLNGIFMPDKGTIKVKGKISALIDIGAGFHPLLTGKENIYVNGIILGLTKKEVDKKFEKIVEFADINDFINVPVKFYSSGMLVRLGFAIAVHSEPNILLVDEVLAVGDASFRRKSINRIQQLREKGTAIVFVSHNMYTVEGFCDSGLYLKNGKTIKTGPISSVVAAYQNVSLDPQVLIKKDAKFRDLLIKEKNIAQTYSSKELDILDLKMFNKKGKKTDTFHTNEEMKITITILPKRKIKDCVLSISARRSDGVRCFMERSCFHGFEFPVLDKNKQRSIEVKISSLQLTAGTYILHVGFSDRSLVESHGRRGGLDIFRVKDEIPNPEYREGIYHPSIKFKIIK